MYYDIQRKHIGNVGVLVLEGDSSQELAIFNGEGIKIASVATDSYSPEDNTIKRLGLLDLLGTFYDGACQHITRVDNAFVQKEAYPITDGTSRLDSDNLLIPIRYLYNDSVVLYADAEGWATPFSVDFDEDDHPVDLFNQHMRAMGLAEESEQYTEVRA